MVRFVIGFYEETYCVKRAKKGILRTKYDQFLGKVLASFLLF
jgi:hypothetical protein